MNTIDFSRQRVAFELHYDFDMEFGRRQFYSDKHHRRSIRLKGYDYSRPGKYFVTICTKDRESLFGDIHNEKMKLNEAGWVAVRCWNELPIHFPNLKLNSFIAMPNHIHEIIQILPQRRGKACLAPTTTSPIAPTFYKFGHPPPNSLPSIIGSYKSAVTKKINQLRGSPLMPVWQRNYYEHIIQNEKELHAIRNYIRNNPKNWPQDENHPNNFKTPSNDTKLRALENTL